MQRLEVSGVVRPIYGYDPYMGTTHIWVVRRQRVKAWKEWLMPAASPGG